MAANVHAIATPEEERAFRHLVDGLRLMAKINLELLPVAPEGRGSLMVSALMCVAGDLLAEFKADLRGQALEHAQDYLARCMAAQVEQNRKEAERCPSSSPVKTSSN
jgi:hypothetical protein